MKILTFIQDITDIENILQFAAQFNSRADESITILANIGNGTDNNHQSVQAILAEACIKVPLPGSQTLIRDGNPVKNILNETEAGNYDLVIVRDRPQHQLERFVRARAVRIADRVPCSVLVIKGKTGPVQRILMCDSGSAESPLLGHFTAGVVELLPGDQDVTVLHVMSQISAGPGVEGEQLRADADELIDIHTPEGDLLERDLHSLEKSGLHTVPKVRHGLVVDEILAEGQNGDYDLIIIGAHRQKWQQFLLEDLSRQIIEQADRPVLIVK